MVGVNLRLLKLCNLKAPSTRESREYVFIKAADGSLSDRRDDHDTFTNRANEVIAISFHTREKNNEEVNW